MSAYRVPRNTIESTLIKRGGGKNGGEKIPIGQYRPLELGEFSSKFKLPSKENVVIAETTGRREIPRREGGGLTFGIELVIRGGLPELCPPKLV